MGLRHKPKAEDYFGTYHFLVAVFYLAAFPGWSGVVAMFLHLVLALILFRLPRSHENGPRWLAVARNILPFGLWATAWLEIGWISVQLNRPGHDGVIKALDSALFGSLWNEYLSSLLPWVWLNEFMHMAYLSYYLLIVGPVIYLAWRKPEGLPEHTANLMGTYLACFAIYLVFPVLGPRSSLIASGQLGPSPGPGFFPSIMEYLFAAGDSAGTAFPSSHCAASLAAALSMRRYCRPWKANLLLGWALLIACSTIYTNNHYTLDAAAGLALAWLIWCWRLAVQNNQASTGLLQKAWAGSATMVVAGKMTPSEKED